jgi:Domain of unknown function (DUF1844)
MNETTAPPVEDVLSEVVVGLAFAAHAYLEPAAEGAQADLGAAEIAIDAAGAVFDRVASRLDDERRAMLSGVLADIRMTFVRKRGL